MMTGQLAALFALTWWLGAGFSQMPDFSGNGNAITLIIFVSTPIEIFLLATFAKRIGNSAAQYLGLIMPSRSEIVFGVAVTVALIIAGNILSWLLGKNIITPFQTDIWRTAGETGVMPAILLLIAVVVITPIGEEILFRGFLFRGWLRAPRDVWPVIIVIAGLWALIHVQYDWYVIAQIFTFGLMLGWMRWATGSTLLTILLHALINLEGMIETFVSAQWLT
ncbi:MAG: type II CAAX endopeptidase family protein [Pseudolabrys sp.]